MTKLSQIGTQRELDRYADENENATSTAGWWRQRAKINPMPTATQKETARAAAADKEAQKVEVARKTLKHCQELHDRGIRNGQLSNSVQKAYMTWGAITARRPELTEPGDERWEALYAAT